MLARMPKTLNELQMETNSPSLHTTVAEERPVGQRSRSRCACACGVARMEPDSETPCFEKMMTHIMLQKNETVLIPASFIRTHGHMLDTVISLTGEKGEPSSIVIKKYPLVRGRGQTHEFRFFLGTGWKKFVQENGFHMGDCLVFRMVRNSCFHVLVSSKLQENAAVETTPLSKCEKERGVGKSGREDDGNKPQPKFARLHPKVKSRDQATAVPKCESDCNPRVTRIRPWRGIPGDNVKEEAVIKHPRLSETDYAKHPGLNAAISSNSRFPLFISKLSKINLRGHGIRLEIPLRFAKEHGHKFQASVRLLGPNGQWRIVKIKISSTFPTTIRVQFRRGWRAFSLENGFTEGDVLLFSLAKFSKFRVQVFPVAAQ